MANCGWEGARLMHHIKPMEKALAIALILDSNGGQAPNTASLPCQLIDHILFYGLVCVVRMLVHDTISACNRVMGPATMQRHESVSQRRILYQGATKSAKR